MHRRVHTIRIVCLSDSRRPAKAVSTSLRIPRATEQDTVTAVAYETV